MADDDKVMPPLQSGSRERQMLALSLFSPFSLFSQSGAQDHRILPPYSQRAFPSKLNLEIPSQTQGFKSYQVDNED